MIVLDIKGIIFKKIYLFRDQIIDDNIVFVKLLNEDYINEINKNRYLKNQAKLIINFFKLLGLCFKKNMFFKLNENDHILISLSQNNHSSLLSFYQNNNIQGKIISYNSYENENSSFILIDTLNTFLASFLHIIFFPLIPFIFNKYKKRFSAFSDESCKSIINYFTIKFINIKKIKEITITNDHNYFTRQIIKRAKQFSVLTTYMPHGQISNIYERPITDRILVDNALSKDIIIKDFNIELSRVTVIGYPKLYNYKINNEEYDFGICSTPSMSIDDIVHIIKELTQKYKIIFRPHPSLMKDNHHFLMRSVEYSNPLKEDIKLFYQKSKKIITGNSGVLFESLFLNKTTFLWTENVENKFGGKNDKDRYNVLKNNYCLELNSTNFQTNILKDHKLNFKQYNDLFPVGVNNINDKIYQIK